MSPTPGRVSIAVDTGGTFTDVVGTFAGGLHIAKVPSTPDDPARAVLEGVRALLALLAEAHGRVPAGYTLVHGSTVATNALLERRGARVALVTNAGFEDVLEIGRQNRPQLYALSGERPPPLVAAADRFGVRGRVGAGGEELEPLDDAELAALAGRLAGVDAIAITLLHSYATPAHEQRVAAALAGLGVPLSVSSVLLPEHREYERAATTVVNAYVAPLMDRYLGRLEAGSGADRLRIMGSAGGALPVSRARGEPVHTVLSGPAGGVMGALAIGRRHGIERLLTFDMGGTSTDVSLVDGAPLHTREFAIAGLPVAVPVLDIHTVGAGGGSIARLDPAGALRVGPASAGARPGPICYGLGGRDVTVTDASVWLGRLVPAAWRHELDAGRLGLDRNAIAGPLRTLADRLGCTPEHAAAGVLAVVDTAMEGALRVISVERGYDPLDFVLVPFGGAAGLHAAELATRLGIPRLLVPPSPGVLSAFGMLVTPVRRHVTRTLLARVEAGEALDLEEAGRPLVEQALAAMRDDGFDAAAVTIRATADVRYRGQSYELTVPADGWEAAFHEAHLARYGHARPGEALEVVTLRVEAASPAAEPPAAKLAAAAPGPPVPAGEHDVWLDGAWRRAPRFDRAALGAGRRLTGPAVVSEYSATLWLPAGWRADVLADGALLATPTA
jgi:N-methylhydantoinase A